MARKTIDQQISDASVAINNGISNVDISRALAVYGYDENKMQQGRNLLAEVQSLQSKQKLEYGEKIASTDNLHDAREASNKLYIPQVKLARIAFSKDRGMSESLQINGRRKESFASWISQASTFYTNILASPSSIDAMAQFNITVEKLQEGQQLVEEVAKALAVQKKETGEAQQSTENRNVKLDELNEWYSDYITVAQIALEDSPQYMEMLGIITPN
ncbi:hypothetical protein [Reichenbachiella versicolor]|uniref:hypothetical protein n=1 Tax=Reichenbachiella versicolor TaxID=1821036 RepID=UPI000D6EA8B9|nr:hypothetical protein [Reichenbachiella versicolor]